jgi:hypothetical protein
MPNLGGLARAQEDELISYKDSEGFFCLSKTDTERLMIMMNQKGATSARTTNYRP